MATIEKTSYIVLIALVFLPVILSHRGIGRVAVGALLLFGFFRSVLIGGVVISTKFDDGYWVLLRDNSDGWVETNWALFYAQELYPWLFIVCFVMLVADTWVRRRRGKKEKASR